MLDLTLPCLGQRQMKVEAEVLPQDEGAVQAQDVTALRQQAARQGENLHGQVPDPSTPVPDGS